MNKIRCLILVFIISSNHLYAKSANDMTNNTSEIVNTDDIGDDDLENEDEEDDEGEEEEENESETVNDPYEKLNRKIFKFNEELDEVLNKVSKPGSKPGLVRRGLSNFAQNFFEIPRFINFTLQGKGKDAGQTISRYIINTFMGFFGIIDVAEKLGLEKKRTVFNDTLKKWGVQPGPFIVIPFLGPTSMRGAVSQMVHLPLDTTALIPIKNLSNFHKRGVYWIAWFFDALNTRSAYGDFLSNITAMSKDRYKTVRNLIMATEK